MLTLAFIRDNRDLVVDRLKIKNFHQLELVDEVIGLDNDRRTCQQETERLQAEMNRKSKEIGGLIQAGKSEEAEQVKKETGSFKEMIKNLGAEHGRILERIRDILSQIPNLPHESVPEGEHAADNQEVRHGGLVPKSGDLPHWELIRKYNIIDFELGTKITGAGFPLYIGKGAMLQRALINFFLDENRKAGYTEYLPPIVVNADSGFGTGQLPDKEGQMYRVPSDDYYLIPTAEVPLTNIFRDVVLDDADLPLKCTAYTPCFRREAGSWGSDVRGLNRLHQFDKVEIVQIRKPEQSYACLEEMVDHVEKLVSALDLPYRIMNLCGGDLGFASAKTYDFEVYARAQDKWLEVSSVSNFEDYQSNRLKIRYKDASGKKNRLVHTLNGSALALPRIVAALLENNQSGEGIRLPEVLQPYAGFDTIG